MLVSWFTPQNEQQILSKDWNLSLTHNISPFLDKFRTEGVSRRRKQEKDVKRREEKRKRREKEDEKGWRGKSNTQYEELVSTLSSLLFSLFLFSLSVSVC